jgi:hypothetical protein
MHDAPSAHREAVVSSALIAGALVVLGFAVLTNSAGLPYALVGLAGTTVLVAYRALLRWEVMLSGLLLLILFVPIKRYSLPGSLPIDLEPYRVVVALLLFCWLGSLLIDPGIRLRAGAFGAPLGLILFVGATSVAVNGPRVAAVPEGGSVIKAVSFLASFVLVYFVVVSVVRSRAHVDLLLKVLVAGGAVVAAAAVVESRTGLNAFDHFGGVVPLLSFDGPAGVSPEALSRSGTNRVFGYAQHPIALAAMLVMLLPVGVYLAMTTARRRLLWWGATVFLGMGAIATVSRTGVIMLAAAGAVLLVLRPKHARRLLPLLAPALVVVWLAVPNTLGSLYGSVFGGGLTGLLSEQRNEVQYAELSSSGRLADIGPTVSQLAREPVLGLGLGTRVPGVNARLLDDQWLLTLAETGIAGFGLWMWVFTIAVRRLSSTARRDHSAHGWLCAGLAASVAAFGVGMLTFDAFSFIQATFILYILLALAAVALATPPEPEGQA